MYKFLFCCCLLFTQLSSFAQPDIISISTTESTCENNGTLSVSAVNVAGTGSLSYILTDGPAGAPYPITIQDPNTTFYSLYPGDYDLRVEDTDGGVTTATATVPGEYVQLDLLLTSADPSCPSGFDGSITATMSFGNDPYEYEITSGPVTTPRGSDNIFTGLPEGNYTVVAYDSCDNFQTRTRVLSDPILSPFSISVGNYTYRVACDSSRFDLGATGGKGPYTYEVIAPISLPPQGNSQLTLQKDPEYTFRISDACGNTDTVKKQYLENMNIFTHSKTCDSFSLSISNFVTFGQDLSYELYASDNATLLAGPQSNDNTFKVPFGFYYVHVTNECGETEVLNRGAYASPPVYFTSFNSYNTSCNINTSNARVYVSSNVSYPVTFTMLEHPSDYAPPAPVTFNFYIGTFSNLTLGSYKVEAVDACGGRDTIDFDITDVHAITFDAAGELGCGLSDNRIQATATSSESGTTFIYKLLYESNGVQIELNNDGDFTNLDSGTYVVLIDVCGNQDFRDTIHFDGYKQPDINPVFGVLCDDGSVTISCTGVDGKPPYLFDIVQGPELRPQQSDPLFENLPTGNNYRVRVEDACGNTFNRDVSVDTFPKVYIAERGRSCVGRSMKMEADTIGGASYRWTGPNGFISNSRSPVFPVLNSSDSGLYVLTLSLGACSKEKTVQKNLRVTQTCPNLPVELAYFKVNYDERNKSVILKWETYSEINTAFFEIQRSANGRDWTMLNVLEAKGSEQRPASYTFVDKQPLPDLSYYRLLMVDYDGSNSSSKIEAVFRSTAKTISVVPNPVKANQVSILLKHGFDTGNVSIFNHLGRIAIAKYFSDQQSIDLDIELLPAGIYYARVRFSDGAFYTQKFIKIDF